MSLPLAQEIYIECLQEGCRGADGTLERHNLKTVCKEPSAQIPRRRGIECATGDVGEMRGNTGTSIANESMMESSFQNLVLEG